MSQICLAGIFSSLPIASSQCRNVSLTLDFSLFAFSTPNPLIKPGVSPQSSLQSQLVSHPIVPILALLGLAINLWTDGLHSTLACPMCPSIKNLILKLGSEQVIALYPMQFSMKRFPLLLFLLCPALHLSRFHAAPASPTSLNWLFHVSTLWMCQTLISAVVKLTDVFLVHILPGHLTKGDHPVPNFCLSASPPLIFLRQFHYVA